MSFTLILDDLNQLPKIAKEFLKRTSPHKKFVFYAEMGVGKTTLIKVICKELGVEDNVSSPTFSIVNEYVNIEGTSVYHFDFYRLENEEEALDMGFEEYFYKNSLCFIEWPEKIPSLIPEEVLKVKITKEKESRIIEIL